jgi:three-Cys-motif partner protein
MTVVLIDKDTKDADTLKASLARFEPYPEGLEVHVLAADSRTLVKEMLSQVGNLAPSFFMIDPYGHPLSVPLINRILTHERTEALITLMWYRINMDLGNPAVQHLVDNLFGDRSWRSQPFVNETGNAREEHFLGFFCSRLEAQFILPFRIGFDPEDAVRGHRTKYYLLHASNHPKAALLMKEVMWPLGDEDGTFDFSGEAQGILISKTPKEDELEHILLQELRGQTLTFDNLRERTWKLPFIERHYRSVLKGLEGCGKISVKRVTSKKTGLGGRDVITFGSQAAHEGARED